MKWFMLRIFGGKEVHGHRTLSPVKLGIGFVIITSVLFVSTIFRSQFVTTFTPGDTIKVNFAGNQSLLPYYHQVKIAFVPVGKVTGVERLPDGTAMVTTKVNKSVRDKLGSAPTATIRPTTLLGGNYFIDLQPGGDQGRFNDDTIPLARTHMPVELDDIARTFQPNAQAGLRGFVTKFNDTLAGGGADALNRLTHDLPDVLPQTAVVLDAARGTNPTQDLPNVVSGLESTSRALTARDGQLASIISNLGITSATFGRRAPEFASTLDDLPSTLTSTQHGLHRLNTTLDILRDTADDARPTARQLKITLDDLTPVLHDARPVVHKLRRVVHDARDVVHDLRPVSDDLTDVLDDLGDKPTLDRVNGPIRGLLRGNYKGSRNGPYARTVSDTPVYKNVFWGLADFDRSTHQTPSGTLFSYGPTVAVEGDEGVIANNGQPRAETLLNSGAAPGRISPPLQPAPPLQSPSDKNSLPMMGNPASSTQNGEGR